MGIFLFPMDGNCKAKLELRKKGVGLRALASQARKFLILSDWFAELLIDIKRLRSEFNIDVDSTKKISPAQACNCTKTHGREHDNSFSRQGDFVTGRGLLSIILRFFTFAIQKNFTDFRMGKHRKDLPLDSDRGKNDSGSS